MGIKRRTTQFMNRGGRGAYNRRLNRLGEILTDWIERQRKIAYGGKSANS